MPSRSCRPMRDTQSCAVSAASEREREREPIWCMSCRQHSQQKNMHSTAPHRSADTSFYRTRRIKLIERCAPDRLRHAILARGSLDLLVRRTLASGLKLVWSYHLIWPTGRWSGRPGRSLVDLENRGQGLKWIWPCRNGGWYSGNDGEVWSGVGPRPKLHSRLLHPGPGSLARPEWMIQQQHHTGARRCCLC
jgi:hypothetical protein